MEFSGRSRSAQRQALSSSVLFQRSCRQFRFAAAPTPESTGSTTGETQEIGQSARNARPGKKMGGALASSSFSCVHCRGERFRSKDLDDANFSKAVPGGHVVRLRKSGVVEDSLPEVVHRAPLCHDNLSKRAAGRIEREQVRPRSHRRPLSILRTKIYANDVPTRHAVFFGRRSNTRRVSSSRGKPPRVP